MSNNLNEIIIQKICAANRINVEVGNSLKKYNRERFALAIKTKGKTVHSSLGKDYISDEKHIVLLPKGADYKWICHSQGECLMIEFNAQPTLKNFGLKSFAVRSQKDFIELFNLIEKNWTFKKQSFLLNCFSYLYSILAKLESTKQSEYEYYNKLCLIEPSIKYMEDNFYDSDLNNEKLASISKISTVYFRKIFFGNYNISPMKYLQKIRLDKAKEMLISDYTSIESIALSLGFKSLYYFSTAFKKYTGFSPTEFARKSF